MSERIRLSKARRAMVAMLRYAHQIPTIPVARQLNVSRLVGPRREAVGAPSWTAIFMRAYGLVCTQFPQLRRSWISWPVPHLHEHPHCDCTLSVEREWQGEKVVLMGRIQKPEETSLEEITRQLRRLQEADILSISSYRLSLRFGGLPGVLQRLLLWNKLDLSGKRRVKYIGTFGLSNYGMHGAESLHSLGPQTTVLSIGPIKPNGDVNVKLVYDHRVVDGSSIARSLTHLEEVLHETILLELRPRLRLGVVQI